WCESWSCLVLRVDATDEWSELRCDVGGLVEVADFAGAPVLHLQVEVAATELGGLQFLGESLGMRFEQRTLFGCGVVTAASASQVRTHVLDAQTDRAQVGQRLQRRDIFSAIAAVTTGRVPVDRLDQTDPLPVAQRALWQPATGHRLRNGVSVL